MPFFSVFFTKTIEITVEADSLEAVNSVASNEALNDPIELGYHDPDWEPYCLKTSDPIPGSKSRRWLDSMIIHEGRFVERLEAVYLELEERIEASNLEFKKKFGIHYYEPETVFVRDRFTLPLPFAAA